MIAANHPVFYTVEEYLQLEEESLNIKHEFIDGQIFAMAGGTLEHAMLATSLIMAISAELKGSKCRVLGSDARVRVKAANHITYPDLSIVCGPWEREHTAITNPLVIVEVLSRRTEAYDRNQKFASYKQIASLREYVLVSQDQRRIEIFSRRSGWSCATYGPGDEIELHSIDALINLDAIYDDATEPTA